MSRDSRDHSSTHDCTTEIELYPRTTTQAIAVTEGHNDEGSLRPSQGDICHDQSSASQSSTPERLQSLAQTSDQVSDTQVRDMGSTNRPAKSSSSKPPLSEDFGLEAGAAVAVQGHTSQNVTVENERLSPQVERMLLDAVRDKMLFMLGATNQDPGNISISDYGFKTMHFKFDVRGSKPVKFGWESLSESADGIKAAQVNKAILDAWPETRESGWVSQDIIESDGRNPAIKVQWSSVGKAYQDDLNAVDKDVPHEIDEVKVGWERYGLKPRQKVIPITHYLFEICRVFEKCMEAWGEALDAIDGLVHVDLNDFDGQSRVEDLMFDKSFDRSKDYFVALQLLRIVDEWLDEVAPSVKELQKDPYLRFTSICAAESVDNFNAAIRSIDERTAVIQKRVRKKVEEINSLRDGLFNATSLRESTKAMALNQAIYVFTVVTVLFTPVSFLATFWALPFLNNPTEGTDIVPVPSSFRNSFIIMPLLTYALVIGVAWFVGQRNGTNALLDLLRELREILGQLIRSAWSLLPRIPRRGSGRSPYP
ncbi:Mg2 transporter protein, CorA-like/Zinc transport protein ZntB [Fusarium oxysporum f. sp. vasinfectum]|nr:Mg2 transporter protein, CorA-like/Zinc transport protein ZntB [Fusarium oxysporum f. sp. vasinfectum]